MAKIVLKLTFWCKSFSGFGAIYLTILARLFPVLYLGSLGLACCKTQSRLIVFFGFLKQVFFACSAAHRIEMRWDASKKGVNSYHIVVLCGRAYLGSFPSSETCWWDDTQWRVELYIKIVVREHTIPPTNRTGGLDVSGYPGLMRVIVIDAKNCELFNKLPITGTLIMSMIPKLTSN